MRLIRPTLITIFALSGALAFGQTSDTPKREDILKGIEECRNLSIDFMRTACLDAANQFLATNASTPQAPDSTATAPSNTNAAPLASPQPDVSNSADIEATRAALAKERAQIEQDRAALQQQAQARSENERLGLLTRLGLARNTENTAEQLAATITIERVTYNRNKIHTFYTSDGDIIRQDPNALRMRLPDSFPATATLERRTLGSKWLTFTDKPKRSYRVQILTPRD